jgi:hypothetical protein
MIIKPQRVSSWVEEQECKPESPWILKDLMQCDSAIQLTGPATIGHKSWFAKACAMVVSSGKSYALLEPLGALPVLYCLQEGPAKPTAGRFRKLEKGLGIPLVDLHLEFSHRQQFFLDDDKAMSEIGAYCKLNGIKLAIIDTLAKVNRGDENSSRDIGACMRGIDRIRNAAPGCSVLYVHHVGKPNKERNGPVDIDEETRGSSALAGAYDIHIALRKRFESQKHLDMTVRGNQLAEKYYSVKWFIENERAYFEMDETKPGDVAESLKDELVNKLMPDRGYRQSDLARIWQLTSAQVKQVVGQLLQENVIEERSKQLWLR